MNEKLEKYADLLLRKGVNLKKKQPLLISAPIEAYEFVRLLTKKAYELGTKDIGYDLIDEEMKHTALQYLDVKQLEKTIFFDKKIFDESKLTIEDYVSDIKTLIF